MKTVETGEEEIKALGFRQFRVRFHGEVVRIEIAPDELARALTLEMARAIHRDFQGAGLPVRHARPRRLPPGLAERSAEPEALRAVLGFLLPASHDDDGDQYHHQYPRDKSHSVIVILPEKNGGRAGVESAGPPAH